MELEGLEMGQVDAFLEGDVEVGLAIRELIHGPIRARLLSRGASPFEAEDLAADLWNDCIPRQYPGARISGSSPASPASLLQRFGRQGSLLAWLTTVATNRLIDLKRQQRAQRRMRETMGPLRTRITGAVVARTDDSLETLLHESLSRAFKACDGDSVLMLRLVHLHGITQRELGRMWHCHETRISRKLAAARNRLRDQTMAHLHARDPWLQLDWEDLAGLCASREFDFLN